MKFYVDAHITYPKKLTVYADSIDEAEQKAADLVMGWNNVEDVSINDIIEADD